MQSQTGDTRSATDNYIGTGSSDEVDHGRQVRSIPPWVMTADDDDDPNHMHPLLLPSSSVPARHHYLHAPQQHKAPGRKWDHLRTAEPALLDQALDVSSARWIPYMHAGPQPHDTEGARLMPDEWMEKNMPGMSGPWHAHEVDQTGEKEKGVWFFNRTRRREAFMRAEV